MNGPFSDNVLVVPDEVQLLPNIAEEAVDVALAQIGGAVEPVGTENPNVELSRAA